MAVAEYVVCVVAGTLSRTPSAVAVLPTNDVDVAELLKEALDVFRGLAGRVVDVSNNKEDVFEKGRIGDIDGVATQEQALETWLGSPSHIETKVGRTEARLIVVVYVLQKGMT